MHQAVVSLDPWLDVVARNDWTTAPIAPVLFVKADRGMSAGDYWVKNLKRIDTYVRVG